MLFRYSTYTQRYSTVDGVHTLDTQFSQILWFNCASNCFLMTLGFDVIA